MERHDVAVIGGGLAGWAAAATAARAGSTVVVVDRDGVGGRAATDRVGRFLFNRGRTRCTTAARERPSFAHSGSSPGVVGHRSAAGTPRGRSSST